MEYTIERAQLGDEAALAHIHVESWKAGFLDILPPDILQSCTQPEYLTAMYRRLLVQDACNGYLMQVAGVPHCMAWWAAAWEPDMPGYAELICIHSLESQWRKGYGTKMMDTVLRDMAAAGHQKVMLWVFEENTRARRFYEANGFATNGRRKADMGPTEVCYERDLSANQETLPAGG